MKIEIAGSLQILAVVIVSAIFASTNPAYAAARIWREKISISIVSPKPPPYLWINQEAPYVAESFCIDQFSDDGGATWHDLGPDTTSPRPTIVWSATIGTFASYSGAHVVYQAADGSLVNDEVNDSITASAITNGKDIFAAPATIEPDPMSSPDITAPHPEAAQLTFDEEIKISNDFSIDRDERIKHLRRAMASRPKPSGKSIRPKRWRLSRLTHPTEIKSGRRHRR